MAAWTNRWVSTSPTGYQRDEACSPDYVQCRTTGGWKREEEAAELVSGGRLAITCQPQQRPPTASSSTCAEAIAPEQEQA